MIDGHLAAPRKAPALRAGPSIFWLGVASMALPTFFTIARDLWTLEQGAHGPIVLATSLWLFYSNRYLIAETAHPGRFLPTILIFIPSLAIYVFARTTSMLGIECLGLYGSFLAIFYGRYGLATIRKLIFPLLYPLFMFPLPEIVLLSISRFLKIEISALAVALLSWFGFQIGQGGVVIYIDQYELLVATACSGLHSLIGLSVICLFYCYMHYSGNWRSALPLVLTIVPIALFANFIRVIALILTTHYFGDYVAQHYVHDFASIFLFAIALAMLVGADGLLHLYRGRRAA